MRVGIKAGDLVRVTKISVIAGLRPSFLPPAVLKVVYVPSGELKGFCISVEDAFGNKENVDRNEISLIYQNEGF